MKMDNTKIAKAAAWLASETNLVHSYPRTPVPPKLQIKS